VGYWVPNCWAIHSRWSCETVSKHRRSDRSAYGPLPLHRRWRIETGRTSCSWPPTCRPTPTTKIQRYPKNHHLGVSAPFACHIQRDPARRDGTYKTPLQQRKQTTNHRHRHKSKLKCTPPGRYLQHQPKTTNSSSNNNNSNTQQQRQLVKLFTSPPKFSLLIFCWFETTRKKNNSRHFSGCVAVEGGGVGGGWGGC